MAIECSCGFTCGTETAFERHLSRVDLFQKNARHFAQHRRITAKQQTMSATLLRSSQFGATAQFRGSSSSETSFDRQCIRPSSQQPDDRHLSTSIPDLSTSIPDLSTTGKLGFPGRCIRRSSPQPDESHNQDGTSKNFWTSKNLLHHQDGAGWQCLAVGRLKEIDRLKEVLSKNEQVTEMMASRSLAEIHELKAALSKSEEAAETATSKAKGSQAYSAKLEQEVVELRSVAHRRLLEIAWLRDNARDVEEASQAASTSLNDVKATDMQSYSHCSLTQLNSLKSRLKSMLESSEQAADETAEQSATSSEEPNSTQARDGTLRSLLSRVEASAQPEKSDLSSRPCQIVQRDGPTPGEMDFPQRFGKDTGIGDSSQMVSSSDLGSQQLAEDGPTPCEMDFRQRFRKDTEIGDSSQQASSSDLGSQQITLEEKLARAEQERDVLLQLLLQQVSNQQLSVAEAERDELGERVVLLEDHLKFTEAQLSTISGRFSDNASQSSLDASQRHVSKSSLCFSEQDVQRDEAQSGAAQCPANQGEMQEGSAVGDDFFKRRLSGRILEFIGFPGPSSKEAGSTPKLGSSRAESESESAVGGPAQGIGCVTPRTPKGTANCWWQSHWAHIAALKEVENSPGQKQQHSGRTDVSSITSTTVGSRSGPLRFDSVPSSTSTITASERGGSKQSESA